jgi:hypothetical protein
MESEQSQSFNERLSQWVANQGFWFQVRYSMLGSGSKGVALYQLLSISFRLAIFALLVAVGYWAYLVKRTDGFAYKEGVRSSLQAGLSGKDSEMGSLIETQGQLVINRFACEGGRDTFFSSLEARNIRAKKTLLDGMFRVWNPGTVSIFKLDLSLHAGADDSESAEMIRKALFKELPMIELNSLEVADASIRWGYSERTRGSILNSNLKIQRLENGLKLEFQGGRFSQNWLKKLEIVKLVVLCDPEGMFFEKAEFKQEFGQVDLSGLRVTGGERPEIKGTAKVRELDLESLVPAALRGIVQGSISGDFKVSGSTNTSDGVGFEGLVTMNGKDMITLRERIYLLKALSVVDYVRNYHRADFNEGSFELKTGGGGMTVSNLSLKASDLLTLDGQMRVRLPTPEEARDSSSRVTSSGGAPLFSVDDADAENAGPKDAEFTLRRAAQEVQREKEKGDQQGFQSVMDRLGMSLELRRLEELAAERASKTLRYEGMFKISVPPDAFDRAPKLAAQYPLDEKTKRIPMVVPIEGSIYDITLKQAEEIYQQGTR